MWSKKKGKGGGKVGRGRESWRRRGVFEWVEEQGRKCQKTRLTLTKKPTEDGSGVRPKARLGAQGLAKQGAQLS